MSKEKQIIEEMAKVASKCMTKWLNNETPKVLPDYIAEAFYNAGYRKQGENNIELPCKIGDTVYIIDEADDECGEDYVLAVKVLQFFINKHGIAIDLALPLGMRLNAWMVVGENVWLTEAEAENALAKMKGGAE
jgi:hypothetical protein